MNEPVHSGAAGTRLPGMWQALERAVGAVVIGQEQPLRYCAIALLVGGHTLLQGVPGVGKTLLVRSLASALDLRFGRVQFTPDLMPSDVLGSPVFDAGKGIFEFRPGPVFTDLLLGDEINRAPAKTQAAMLEAMQERQVTSNGERFLLGEFFSLFATQNPIEQEGTYPLPEAELDRFLFRVDLTYPSRDAERTLLQTHHAADANPSAAPPVWTREALAEARQAVAEVVVRDEVVDYVLDLVRATRDDPGLAVGGSPRATLWLLRAAKAAAALGGRDFVVPDDVQFVWLPTFRHRVVLQPGTEVEGLSADDVLRQVLARVPVPH